MRLERQRYIARRNPAEMSFEEEDAGLFKQAVQTYAVQLVPVVTRNGRDDVIVRGYQGAAGPFEVVFAGRRAGMVEDLLQSLNSLKADRAVKDLEAEGFRLDTHIEGAWRRRFWTDDSGWQDGIYQLVASRWAVVMHGLPERMQGEKTAYPLR